MDYGTHNVGEKLPNELGLYDMSGNVHEMCFDWYGVYPGDSYDYRGPSIGEYRVIRGGDWITYSFNRSFCEVSYRVILYPYNEGTSGGFRVVYK